MESICGSPNWLREEVICGSGVLRGRPFRHCNAKRGFKESRMQTAKAMVSRGRETRVRIAWMRGVEGSVRETEEGIRFVRWIAGPVNDD